MSKTETLSQGSIVEYATDYEIMLLEISGIEYERAPGGKVVGLKLKDEIIVPLKLMGPNGRKTIELKRTKSVPQPSADQNRYRFTLVSIDPAESKGYSIRLKIDEIPLPKITYAKVSNTLRSGDEIEGPDGLMIRHEGYQMAHTMTSDGRSGAKSSCMIQVSNGKESKRFYIGAPLKEPFVGEWKSWKLTFTKTDPDGGTMPTQAPVEFTVTKK